MTAKQTSRVLLWQSTARLGLVASCLALMSACGGSIEETDVDKVHLENGNTGLPQKAAPTAASMTPAAANPAAANPAAANPPAANPPAANPPAANPPAATDPDPDPPAAAADALSFKADIWPIFNTKCAPCHTGAGSGGQDIGDADKDAAFDDAKAFKTAIVSDLNTGAMPLGCGKPPGGGSGCVSQDEFATIKDWIDGGTPP